MVNWHEHFRKFAHAAATALGSSAAFFVGLSAVAIWALTGPLFGFSDTWQLVINTSTTILTFLMIFLVQNTQNRDTKAIHLKLDELISAVDAARNRLVGLESLTDQELDVLEAEFQKLRQKNTPV